MTGRLTGTVLGRPVQIDAEGRELLLGVSSLRSAWRLRRSASANMVPILRRLRDHGFRLRIGIGDRFSLELFPKAHFALRILAPELLLPETRIADAGEA